MRVSPQNHQQGEKCFLSLVFSLSLHSHSSSRTHSLPKLIYGSFNFSPHHIPFFPFSLPTPTKTTTLFSFSLSKTHSSHFQPSPPSQQQQAPQHAGHARRQRQRCRRGSHGPRPIVTRHVAVLPAQQPLDLPRGFPHSGHWLVPLWHRCCFSARNTHLACFWPSWVPPCCHLFRHCK